MLVISKSPVIAAFSWAPPTLGIVSEYVPELSTIVSVAVPGSALASRIASRRLSLPPLASSVKTVGM